VFHVGRVGKPNLPGICPEKFALMFLKNYTSQVPVSETIRRIEQVLIRCGVLGITKEYAPDATVSAIMFHLPLENRATITVRLPADKDRALEALWLDYVGPDKEWLNVKRDAFVSGNKKKRRRDFAEQAERTAWKIVQDWVEVQMSMIQMQQAETVEVFMPYVWDGKETLYHRLKHSGFKALLPEKTEN
jgi:hypothetical protein